MPKQLVVKEGSCRGRSTMIGLWSEIRSGMLSFNSLTDSVSVAPRVDCMTTKVAIAAQYASGICTSRAIITDTVAATAVRVACAIEEVLFVPIPQFHINMIFPTSLLWQDRQSSGVGPFISRKREQPTSR